MLACHPLRSEQRDHIMDGDDVAAKLREQGHADVIETMEDVDVPRPQPHGNEAKKSQQTALDALEVLIDDAIGTVDTLQTGVRSRENHELQLRIAVSGRAQAGSHQVGGGGPDASSP